MARSLSNAPCCPSSRDSTASTSSSNQRGGKSTRDGVAQLFVSKQVNLRWGISIFRMCAALAVVKECNDDFAP